MVQLDKIYLKSTKFYSKLYFALCSAFSFRYITEMKKSVLVIPNEQ